MSEIVRVRDTNRWSWDKISDYIERLLAEREGRKPIPAYDQGKRMWTRHKCHGSERGRS
jgi:hypothetical protein